MSVLPADGFNTLPQTAPTSSPISSVFYKISDNIFPATGSRILYSIGGVDASIDTPNQGLRFGTPPDLELLLEYAYSSVQDFTSLKYLSLLNIDTNSVPVTFRFVFSNGDNFEGTTTGGNLSVYINSSGLSSVSTLRIYIVGAATIPATTVYVQSLVHYFFCIAENSLILTTEGYKFVQEIERGDECMIYDKTYKVARLIRMKLPPEQSIEAIIIKPSALGYNIPIQETILCSEHYIFLAQKFRLAKSLLPYQGVNMQKGKACELLPSSSNGNYYFYDIQYEEEGMYLVNNVPSQSRSPFASISPLPKELYFNKEKYEETRVVNCKSILPTSYKYLLPNGEEVESFIKMIVK